MSKAKRFNPLVSLLLVLLAIALLGLSVINHYGISWDEEATIGVVDVNYEIVTQGGENNHQQYHRQYYGTWFNIGAEAIFKGQLKGQEIAGSPVDISNPDALLLAKIRSKHVVTFLLSLVTYAAVAGIVAMLAGKAYAWLGPMVLWLLPRFWGNSFFNPKDIPLAAMFTLGTLLGACLIRYYFRCDRQQSPGLNTTTGYTLLYGLLIGVVAGTRIDSSVLWLYVAFVDITLQLSEGKPIGQIIRFCRFYLLLLLTGAIAIVTIYPGSWIDPINWYLSAFNFYYKEDWPHTVLFQGVDVPANSLPWHYLPTWISITTPAVILLLFTVGLILAVLKFQKLSTGQKACSLLVGLQAFGLPIFAMLYQATMFDSLRQILYVLPAMAAIAATAVAWSYHAFAQAFSASLPKLAFAAAVIALSVPIAFDMAALHPYEYAYFNRAFGGLSAAENRFDTDYWGVSMADTVEWINREGDRNLPLVSSDPIISARLLADEAIEVVPYDELEDDSEINSLSFYYLSLPRWGWEHRLESCPVVYATARQGVMISRIKHCKN